MDAPGSVKLNASGATFPQPLYEDWAFAFNQLDPSVVINYAGGGSGQGIKDIKAGTVDFAGSDALLTDKDYADAPDLQMIPTVAGAVVLAYNVKGITTSITLDANTVAGIYLGKIEKWNDPAIAKLNPDVKFPDLPINVVHRSDGSGTTNIFTLYLSAVSEDWKKGPGAGTAVDWPVDKLDAGRAARAIPASPRRFKTRTARSATWNWPTPRATASCTPRWSTLPARRSRPASPARSRRSRTRSSVTS